MTRITTTIVVFMILLNGSVTIMSASGLSEDLGVSLAPGVESSMDKLVSDMKKGFSPNAGLGETLFTLFVGALRLFRVIVEGLYAAPSMFLNLGFPSWLVIPLFAPLYMLSTLELVYVATGRNTI